MNAWTKEDGTKTMLVNSTSVSKAQRQIDERMNGIRESLAMIETELQKYESLYCPDWGHVGDLAHVDELLTQVYEFIHDAE